MLEHVLFIALFTLIIHTSETLSYAIRLAGVRTGKLAVALTLTGTIVLISRTSNMIQGPMLGGLTDLAGELHFDVEQDFRLIIAAASLGTALAILLFPTFVGLSTRLIAHLDRAGSIPQMLRKSISVQSIKHVGYHLRRPKWDLLSRFRLGGVPKRLLLLNCIITSIYTISILSALYGSLLNPNYKTAVLMSSPLINGFATIIFTILVDPQVAVLTDKAIQGHTEPQQIQNIYVWLMISRFFGTLLGQVIFLPAAYWVAWIGPLFH